MRGDDVTDCGRIVLGARNAYRVLYDSARQYPYVVQWRPRWWPFWWFDAHDQVGPPYDYDTPEDAAACLRALWAADVPRVRHVVKVVKEQQ